MTENHGQLRRLVDQFNGRWAPLPQVRNGTYTLSHGKGNTSKVMAYYRRARRQPAGSELAPPELPPVLRSPANEAAVSVDGNSPDGRPGPVATSARRVVPG